MPRFVILEHDHPEVHWDLMLEAGTVLHTWRLAKPPHGSGDEINATELSDHRLLYLEYEGPVSGGRGTVQRWDAGVFDEEFDSLPERRRLYLHGKRWTGRVCLERVAETKWQLKALP